MSGCVLAQSEGMPETKLDCLTNAYNWAGIPSKLLVVVLAITFWVILMSMRSRRTAIVWNARIWPVALPKRTLLPFLNMVSPRLDWAALAGFGRA